jgi:hypothetical protein
VKELENLSNSMMKSAQNHEFSNKKKKSSTTVYRRNTKYLSRKLIKIEQDSDQEGSKVSSFNVQDAQKELEADFSESELKILRMERRLN